MGRKRIEWIDIAKGISIILVVYGHCGLNSVPVIGAWLHAYRMPFFFLYRAYCFPVVNMIPLCHFCRRE